MFSPIRQAIMSVMRGSRASCRKTGWRVVMLMPYRLPPLLPPVSSTSRSFSTSSSGRTSFTTTYCRQQLRWSKLHEIGGNTEGGHARLLPYTASHPLVPAPASSSHTVAASYLVNAARGVTVARGAPCSARIRSWTPRGVVQARRTVRGHTRQSNALTYSLRLCTRDPCANEGCHPF